MWENQEQVSDVRWWVAGGKDGDAGPWQFISSVFGLPLPAEFLFAELGGGGGGGGPGKLFLVESE